MTNEAANEVLRKMRRLVNAAEREAEKDAVALTGDPYEDSRVWDEDYADLWDELSSWLHKKAKQRGRNRRKEM